MARIYCPAKWHANTIQNMQQLLSKSNIGVGIFPRNKLIQLRILIFITCCPLFVGSPHYMNIVIAFLFVRASRYIQSYAIRFAWEYLLAACVCFLFSIPLQLLNIIILCTIHLALFIKVVRLIWWWMNTCRFGHKLSNTIEQ